MWMLRRLVVALIFATIWSEPTFPQENPSPEPGEATFTVFIQSTPIGLERTNVTRTPTGWMITSNSQLSSPLDISSHVFEMRYSADWHPLELKIDATVKGRPYELHTTFEENIATNKIQESGQTKTHTNPISAETLVLPVNFFAAYEALAVRLSSIEVGSEFPVYVPPLGEIKAKLTSFSDDEILTATELINARRYEVTFLSPELPIEAEIWASDNHRLLRVKIPTASIDMARLDISSTAARLVRVRNAGDFDVRVPASGFSLGATITKPVEDKLIEGERLPAVLLVPGSDSVDRDETVYGIPIFGQIAGALADTGFLVARYDRRGVGQSGGRTERATLADYAKDAQSMVKYLDKRKDLDDKRIVVIGHGEGGWVSLLAAAREKKIAALVLIATPGTLGADLILEQQQLALDRMQVSEDEKQIKIKLQKQIQEAVISGNGWADIPTDIRRQADTPWFRSLLTFDPGNVMRKLKQPIMIVQGKLDKQVPPHHADRLEQVARARTIKVSRAAYADFKVARLDGINHLLVPSTTGEIDEYASLTHKTVSADVVSAITEWLSEILPQR